MQSSNRPVALVTGASTGIGAIYAGRLARRWCSPGRWSLGQRRWAVLTASLTLSFGLVSIPVKLYSATEASRAISFNLLHKDCGSRLKQQYFCIKEEVPVAREDMVKGYEFAKDQYVVIDTDESTGFRVTLEQLEDGLLAELGAQLPPQPIVAISGAW